MATSQVTVPWPDGLHLRRAAVLTRLAQRFRSTISLRSGTNLADARSILSIMMLCASMGTTLVVETTGNDESAALEAVESVFRVDREDGAVG